MHRCLSIIFVIFWSSVAFGSGGTWPVPANHFTSSGGGFIGNSDITGRIAFTTVDDVNQCIIAPFTTASDGGGEISRLVVDIQTNGSGFDYNVAIYSSDGNTKLSDGTLTELSIVDGEQAFTLDSSVTLANSTEYLIVYGSSDNNSWKGRFSSIASTAYRRYAPCTVGDTMPTTISPTAGSAGVGGYTAIAYGDNN